MLDDEHESASDGRGRFEADAASRPVAHFLLRLALSEGREVVHGQAFIAHSAVNALNEGLFHWFAGPNEVERIPRR